MTATSVVPIETPPEWFRPKTGKACGRDPAAGPGSCALWWEGCPKAEKRGRYQLWVKCDAVRTYWAAKAPEAWTPAPDALPPGTAGALRDRGVIEIRQPDGARWQWRRRPPPPPERPAISQWEPRRQ